MKKFVLLSLLMACTISISAQQTRGFAKLSLGGDPSTQGGLLTLKSEYGQSFGIFNLSLSGLIASSLPLEETYHQFDNINGESVSANSRHDMDGRMGYSLMLNLSMDALRIFFANSRHRFFIGGGVGLTQFNRVTHQSTEQSRHFKYNLESGFDYSLRAEYQYALTEKWSLGSYLELQQRMEMAPFGISITRSF